MIHHPPTPQTTLVSATETTNRRSHTMKRSPAFEELRCQRTNPSRIKVIAIEATSHVMSFALSPCVQRISTTVAATIALTNTLGSACR